MIKLMLLVTLFFTFVFGYLEINDVVGKVIDAEEAQYYRIFSDVSGFETARFIENGDSVLVEINTEINGTHDTQYRNIDPKVYIAMRDFIKDFNGITMDRFFRADFVCKHSIGWPLVTQKDMDRAVSEFNKRKNVNTAFCMSCIVPSSAYAGGCVGREVISSGTDACGMPYAFVRINKAACLGVTAAGTLGGCILSENLSQPKINENLLKKDIVAFDRYSQPITIQDVNYASVSNNRIFYGCLGFGLGCGGAIVTFYGLIIPLIGDMYQSDGDKNSVLFPIIGVSLSEIAIITKFFVDEGNKKDLKATIEKIKQKRIKEHLKSQKAEDR
jgi:hypothetical protein